MALALVTRHTGVVKAYNDCTIYHLVKGKYTEESARGRVFSEIGDEAALTVNNASRSVTIGTGVLMFFGRQFSIDAPITISLNSLTGINYIVLYFEINTYNITDERVELKIEALGGFFPVIESDNLYKQQQGIARFPLYQFIYNASGVDHFSSISNVHDVMKPGVDDSTESLPSTSFINGRPVANLTYNNQDKWREARLIEDADAVEYIQNDNTLPLDTNQVTDELGLPGRKTQLVHQAVKRVFTPNDYFSDSGIEGYAWRPGTFINVPIISTRDQFEINHFAVRFKIDTAVWVPGFLGIGSKYEWELQNGEMVIIAAPGTKILFSRTPVPGNPGYDLIATASEFTDYDVPIGELTLPENVNGTATLTINEFNRPGNLGRGRVAVFGSIEITTLYIGA